MRVIRVPGVGGDFLVPRGWPQPTDRWIRENLYWQPPAGWVPQPGLRPAPAHWRYWRPNPLWYQMSAPLFRGIAPWRTAGLTFLWVWLAMAVAVLVLPLTAVQTLLGTIATFGALVTFIVHRTLRHRRMRTALVRIRIEAETQRTGRLIREYQAYLSAGS